jgi:hypothetical protein
MGAHPGALHGDSNTKHVNTHACVYVGLPSTPGGRIYCTSGCRARVELFSVRVPLNVDVTICDWSPGPITCVGMCSGCALHMWLGVWMPSGRYDVCREFKFLYVLRIPVLALSYIPNLT